jgi:glycosyltransferase involved in cell wall biosynthesis
MSTPEANPPSVWVPLRKLYEHGRARIFFNTSRLDPHHAGDREAWRRVVSLMRPEDHIVWGTYWHADAAYFTQAADFFSGLPVPPHQIWVLGNTQDETAAARAAGFRSAWVNHNAWLEEDRFPLVRAAKEFRAVMVAQLAPYKRIHLAARVRGLALVPAALFHLHQPVDITCLQDVRLLSDLPSHQVAGVLQRSCTGLILSEEEGACYASSEYLLSGLPVVSTPSRGGRDVFFTSTNSLIVEPTEEAVARGVDRLIEQAPDGWLIRHQHIVMSHLFRQRFVDEVLAVILREARLPGEAPRLFQKIFRHKMAEFMEEEQARALVTG